MKFIVFASCIHVDILSQEGTEKFIEEVTDFYCMTIENKDGYVKEDYLFTVLKKVERYGSFIFVSEDKFNKLCVHSDE